MSADGLKLLKGQGVYFDPREIVAIQGVSDSRTKILFKGNQLIVDRSWPMLMKDLSDMRKEGD